MNVRCESCEHAVRYRGERVADWRPICNVRAMNRRYVYECEMRALQINAAHVFTMAGYAIRFKWKLCVLCVARACCASGADAVTIAVSQVLRFIVTFQQISMHGISPFKLSNSVCEYVKNVLCGIAYNYVKLNWRRCENDAEPFSESVVCLCERRWYVHACGMDEFQRWPAFRIHLFTFNDR